MPVRYSNGPETRRISHRELTSADAKFFYQLNSHPDVMQFTGDQILCNEDQARHALQHYPDFNEVGYGRWGCVLKTNQQLIGFCGLKYLPEQDAVDLGYRFFPEYWGQGLATEAASACLGFGFQTIGLHQILGIALPENLASIRVLTKLGMKRDGDFVEGNLRAHRYVCTADNWLAQNH
ncbi:MAG: GNAT family N-acetyltransferase [Fuerstiella sp.]